MPENAGKDNKRFNYRDHAIVILPGDVKVLASAETRPSRQWLSSKHRKPERQASSR
jgi:hypothetical protein